MTRALVVLAALAALLVGATQSRTGLAVPADVGAASAVEAGGAEAAAGGEAAPATAALAYRWPTASPPAVLRPFLPPPRPWQAGHRGVDLALDVGAAVLAAGAGVVVAAGPVAGRPVVSVAHPDGLRTTYEPVAPALRPGDAVRAGDVLGTLAVGDHCPRACLHWGARRGPDEYVDPLLLVRRVAVRLYPAPGPAPD